jgi:hypothetical protein
MAWASFGTYDINDNDWHIVGNPNTSYTLRNVGSNPIGVYYSAFDIVPSPEPDLFKDIIQLGGFTDIVKTPNNKFIWVKALNQTPVSLRYVEEGHLDPDSDLKAITTVVVNLLNDFADHKLNPNPHDITKEKIGLGNIPNEISINKTSNSDSVLATTSMVQSALADIKSVLNAHINNKDNPHDVTKDQVGLGLVENVKVVIPKESVPPTSRPPHTLAVGYQKITPVGWTFKDCDQESDICTIVDNETVKLKENCTFIYTFDGKAYESKPSIDLFVTIPAVDTKYYLYIDLHDIYTDDSDGILIGQINSLYSTSVPPIAHTSINQGTGDWFNISTYKLLSSVNAEINRVYIGTVERVNGDLTNLITIPYGNRFIAPVIEYNSLILGQATEINNPFIYPVETYAQVSYINKWQSSSWNDQIGVKAYPKPGDNSKIIVQIGLMGWLADSRASGNSFELNTTITTPLPIRVIIQRIF